MCWVADSIFDICYVLIAHAQLHYVHISSWFLADCTACSRIGCGIVKLTVCLWCCVLWLSDTSYNKCLNKWIGSSLLGTHRYNFEPPTPTLSPQTSRPQNFCVNSASFLLSWSLVRWCLSISSFAFPVSDVHALLFQGCAWCSGHHPATGRVHTISFLPLVSCL